MPEIALRSPLNPHQGGAVTGIGEVLEPSQDAMAAVAEARQSVWAASEQLTRALATLAPLAPEGLATAVRYRRARDILREQLTVLDNAIAAIAD